jgi:hypothetical protein
MKLLKTMSLGLLLGFSVLGSAQSNPDKTDKLKSVLKQSLYKPEISIDEKKNLDRSDNNGNSFKLNLNDIQEINYSFDGFHNVVLIMKEDKKVVVYISGNQTDQKLNVYSFENKNDCDKAIELFNQLIH